MTLHLLSSLALASTLAAIRPAFEARAGIAIEATLLPTALLLPRIRAGERADLAILTSGGITALIDEAVVDPASRRDLAVSTVGIGVRAGALRPPLRTTEDLVAALRAARSVALSRAGASGLYFDTLLARLGILDEVHAKAVVIASGYTGELLTDGRAELAVQQVSELMMVPGVDVAGPLPPGLGAETVFSGGVFRGAAQADAAAALMEAIIADPALLQAHGLAPV